MILMELKMENFRQYYGVQSVEFSYDKSQNVTILFGENGKGKTGIYRAVMFGLFGNKYISQDNPNDLIHLVNLKKINENDGKAEATVSVKFVSGEYTYIIERKVSAFKVNNQIRETLGQSSLSQIDQEGNVNPDILTEIDQIKDKINAIMDEEIKDFFLFDGEKIDTLAKSDKQSRKEVKNAIQKLLNIDTLTTAKERIDEEVKSLRNKIRNERVDYNRENPEEKLSKIKEDQENYELRIKNNHLEINNIDAVIAKNQNTLEQNKEIILKKEEKNKLNNDLMENSENIKAIKNNINNVLIKRLPHLLTFEIVNTNYNLISNFVGESKYSIPEELLTESLKNNHCIVCDNNLNENYISRNHIEHLLESNTFSETYSLARDLINYIESGKINYDNEKENLLHQIRHYDNLISKRNEIIKKKEKLAKETREFAKSDVDLKVIQNIIDQESRKKLMLEIDSEEYNKKITELLQEEEKFQNLIDENIKNSKKVDVDTKTFNILYEIGKDIKTIEKEFTTNMRELLGNYTTDIFKMLIDKKDKDIIDRVDITSSFEINATNKSKIIFTQDISQGQRQILALSFITALAKLASRDEAENKIDYPLFMDSPFNRLSGLNRDNLIENIPNLTSQWILLLTDTELTLSEEAMFKQTGRIGNWYRINQIEVNHSEIEKVSLNQSLATRGGL